MKSSYPDTAVAFWCGLFGYSRQSYYQYLAKTERWILLESIVLDLVHEYRERLPHTGTRKLYAALKKDFDRSGLRIGRDKLHAILQDNGLIVSYKRRATRTTIPHWRWRKYPDLREGLEVLASELLWVSDITYLRTQEGFVYLSLITDAYCRKIVGWCCHPTLETTGCLISLTMALGQRQYPERQLIHHSDRGTQYCSEAYTNSLEQHYIDISVTQTGSVYDNPMAESMNAQLKVELGLDATFVDLEEARQACEQAIRKYNEIRQHGSIDYLTPEQAYHREGPIASRWQRKNQPALSTYSRTADQAVKLYQDKMNCVNYQPDDKL